MFWNNVADIYDVFVNVVNAETHRKLKQLVAEQIDPEDDVLECACGTGMLSAIIAEKSRSLTATDFAPRMIARAKKNCAGFRNIVFEQADITALTYADDYFDKVVAGNVIHLLDEPMKALDEMNRVCKEGGTLIIPTYLNKNRKGQTSNFATAVGKAGADFKRQFTMENYKQFFLDAGFRDVQVSLAEGRIPCAVAVMKKRSGERI